ncbi:hypothetical protein [Lactobacillus gallinarum]|uniref:hypothetical protein n=1 Tax=Lactobacillus gallinarum TaxID=52242 RepID=UPI0024B170AF|nr:hypothetical protein [Lactobacillus gallinarum]
MNKKSLFKSTVKEVATSSAMELFQLKYKELQIERNKGIEKIKNVNKKGHLNKINTKEQLRNSGLTPKVTINDLELYYFKKTGYTIHKDTLLDILHGKATIANQKLVDLRSFLGKNYPSELFYLAFKDDNHSIAYEHRLFFDILDEAKKQIIKYIPTSNSYRTSALSTLRLALSEWGTTKIDLEMSEMIMMLWEQTMLLLPIARKLNDLIELSDNHPDQFSQNIKEYFYDFMFMLIKGVYQPILNYDNAPSFPHESFRFQTYNQLSSLNRKHIQDHAFENLFMLVTSTNTVLKALHYPDYQWNIPEGQKEILKAISKYTSEIFTNFSKRYGNDFKLNVFK